MHGQKKRRKRSLIGATEIEGHKLAWELISEPQHTSDGYKGLTVSVRAGDATTRELLIEFPYDRTVFLPQRPTLTPTIVEGEIRAALAQGWNPDSRGRAYVFASDTKLETGGTPAGRLNYLAD
jgi:hypothetical protein